MLPDEEVVDGDVGHLRLRPVGTQESQPVLGGDDVVWVGGGLGQLHGVQEVQELLGGQGEDVFPHHGGLPLIAVGAGPAKFALAAVEAGKVPCDTESTATPSVWGCFQGVHTCFQKRDLPVHLHVWLKNLVGHLSRSSTFLRLYGPPQGLVSTRTAVQAPLPDREPQTLAGSEPRAGQHCLDRMPCTVQQTRGN